MDTRSCPLLLVCMYLVAALIGGVGSEGACLQDGRHKATPGPEPELKDCALYADNSCCSPQDIQDISQVQGAGQQTDPWDRCGPLSSQCEGFLKRVSCFYRCSPDAARWPHPQHHAHLQAVPLCHSFCRDWFDACRTDLTCARNWARDPRGQNCTGSCVQYQQMYQHGRDLCESLWGDAFMTVEDEQEEVGGAVGVADGRPCGCLSLSPSDRDVFAALRARGTEPEELDTTKSDLPQYRAPCQSTPPPQARGRKWNALRKRSLMVDDAEGSGSGL